MTYADLMAIARKIDPARGTYVSFLIRGADGSTWSKAAFTQADAKKLILQHSDDGRVVSAYLKTKPSRSSYNTMRR